MSTLSDEAHLELRKALILRLRVLVPAVFVPAALCGLTATLVSGLGSGALFRAIGVFGIATWVAGRVVGTVPVNRRTLTWATKSPPQISDRSSTMPNGFTCSACGRWYWSSSVF